MPKSFEKRLAAFLTIALALSSVTGCVSGSGRKYTAVDMPAFLRVAKRTSPHEANLTRLAGVPTGSQVIGPGDVLKVSIAPALSKSEVLPPYTVRVDENGQVRLPELGLVHIAGLRPDTAGAAIETEYVTNKKYVNPVVTVLIEQKRLNVVRVFGGVRKPGTYELPAGQSDVLSAVLAAGGLAEDAGDRVEVLTPRSDYLARTAEKGIQQAGYSDTTTGAPAMTTQTISLVSLSRSGSRGSRVEDGGVVMVQKLDPVPITVTGLVDKPGPIEYPIGKDIDVLSAIARAGGLSNKFANRVLIIRPAPSGDPYNIDVSIREAKRSNRANLLLAPGDVVSVEQTPTTIFMDTIRLIRFGVSSNVTQFF